MFLGWLGFTSERLPPQEDHTLPERFSLGLVGIMPFRIGQELIYLILDKPCPSTYG